MLTFEERVLCGNPLQQSGSGSEPDLDPNRAFGPVVNTRIILRVTGLCGQFTHIWTDGKKSL
jgi:hypothetical protein